MIGPSPRAGIVRQLFDVLVGRPSTESWDITGTAFNLRSRSEMERWHSAPRQRRGHPRGVDAGARPKRQRLRGTFRPIGQRRVPAPCPNSSSTIIGSDITKACGLSWSRRTYVRRCPSRDPTAAARWAAQFLRTGGVIGRSA